jgi:hypothetical protein
VPLQALPAAVALLAEGNCRGERAAARRWRGAHLAPGCCCCCCCYS